MVTLTIILQIGFLILHLLEDGDVDTMATRIHIDHQGTGFADIFSVKCWETVLQENPHLKKEIRLSLALPAVERMVTAPHSMWTCIRKWVCGVC